jgi:predicted amidohydrolase YtcJ
MANVPISHIVELKIMFSKRFLFLTIAWFTFGILVISCVGFHPKAELVIHNGTVYTLNEKQPIVKMVAVSGGKIIFTGQEKSINSWIGARTKVLNLQGKTMTPGFIESHGHILYLGYSKMILDLSRVKNYEELVDKVAQAVRQTQPGEWILGRGWHQSKWNPPPRTLVHGFQTHQALSNVSPQNPVFLTHASGHAGIANAKAMEFAGVNPSSVFVEGGEIIKTADGDLTGIFTEKAQALITRHIPETTPQKNRRALKMAIDEIMANGLTSFSDAGSGREAIGLYREFLDQKKLKIRLWVMIDGQDQSLLEEWFTKGPEVGTGNHFLTVRAIKLFADGALGSRGAWLLNPYSDRPQHSGHATISMDSVYNISQKALAHGFQVAVHAIGDRANREVLDQFEIALQENPAAAKDHRFRIEHAQHINEHDIARFAKLGVIASMQAIHHSSDRPWAIKRLGKNRIEEGAYVWQKLLQTGAIIVNGTDAPVEPIDPIACFYAAVTRRTLEGYPPGGYEPDQRMTRLQALRSYTLDAAFGSFEEDIKGSIEKGKLADFTVFSQDLMQVPADRILETQVAYTIINGEVVYQREKGR